MMGTEEFRRLPTEELLADRSDRENWNHVKNLDEFFQNMYQYYESKGLGHRAGAVHVYDIAGIHYWT